MVYHKELHARIREHFRFSKAEISGLIPAILVTAFIFSFRDWGAEQFEIGVGLQNLFILIIVAAISFFFRFSCQKIYGLAEGYKVDFKLWWMGLAIALVIAFISKGGLQLILVGTVVSAFMIKQRLGEFRYGFSYWNSAMISLWGILGNLIIALLFAIGNYAYPEIYFFSKGLWLNIMMALGALLPLPQLEGLNIFFGSRRLYFVALLVVVVSAGLLLLAKTFETKLPLIMLIVVGALAGIIYILTGSQK